MTGHDTMENSYYLYLTSEDSTDRHPENSPSDFTVELPRPLSLTGDWECCLKELCAPPGFEVLYVCSDLCLESFACDTSYPVLRVVYGSTKSKKKSSLTFDNPYYVRVYTDRLHRLRIFIRGERLEPISFKSGTVTCTLHLTRVSP
jgi:hypothetical protein